MGLEQNRLGTLLVVWRRKYRFEKNQEVVALDYVRAGEIRGKLT